MKVAASLILGFALSAATPLALHAQAFDRFAAYEHCRFTDGLALVENTPLAKGIEGRTVKTIMGPRNVPLAGGTRLMYAYPGTEPFANVKVEQIPADDYKQARQDLIANFEQILTGDDSSTRNYTLKPRVNGLEIYGLDRKKLEGGVLGIYLFFVDRTHTVTTIYFLNQEPTLRKFSSLEEYATLRDGFVATYTGCAGGHPIAASTGKLPAMAPTGENVAATITPSPATGTPAPVAAAPPSGASALPDAPLPNGVHAVEAAPVTAAIPEPVAKPVPRKQGAKAPSKTPAKSAHTETAKAKAGKKPALSPHAVSAKSAKNKKPATKTATPKKKKKP